MNRYIFVKRILDFVFALILLIIASSIMFLAAIAIKLESNGPVLFKQLRPGKNEKIFRVFKFRTMVVETESESKTLTDKERITKVGSFLRRSSIDELPQLFNILRGEMSFIGTRPLLVQYLELYSPEQKRRHEVAPGISGWAQVNGRNKLSWEEKFILDVWYVDNMNLALDVKILFLTLIQILVSKDIDQNTENTMDNFMGNLVNIKTPYYLIDYAELDNNYNKMKKEFSDYWKGKVYIGYSFKTNHLRWIIEFMKRKGAYAEVVSHDEYCLAELVGYKPNEIIFNGPVKTGKTLINALLNGSIVNIDSFTELKQIYLMDNLKKIKIGLRVNFDLESECPGESAMGTDPSRFGFCLENGDFEKALNICKEKEVVVCGLHMHQSTKTRSLKVFEALAKKAAKCIRDYDLKDNLEYIDIGGGFYGSKNMINKPTYEGYAKIISECLTAEVNPDKTTLIIEPGASLVSSPISYLTKVIDIKSIRNNRIVTVDGSILHINPFLVKRQPSYKIYSQGDIYSDVQTISGSTCMENDRLMQLNNLPKLNEGDIVEFEKCGSYTMCYNSFFINMPPAVYVKKDGKYEIVRESLSPKLLL